MPGRGIIGLLLVLLGLWVMWLVIAGKRLWFEPQPSAATNGGGGGGSF